MVKYHKETIKIKICDLATKRQLRLCCKGWKGGGIFKRPEFLTDDNEIWTYAVIYHKETIKIFFLSCSLAVAYTAVRTRIVIGQYLGF